MSRALYAWELAEAAKLADRMDKVDNDLSSVFEMSLGVIPLYSHDELLGHLIPGEVGWEYKPYDGPTVKATYLVD